MDEEKRVYKYVGPQIDKHGIPRVEGGYVMGDAGRKYMIVLCRPDDVRILLQNVDSKSMLWVHHSEVDFDSYKKTKQKERTEIENG